MLAEIYIIFLICLIASGIGTYKLGKKDGIQGTVEYLIEEGLLEVDE